MRSMERIVKMPVLLLLLTVWGVIGLIVALANDYGDIDTGSDGWTFALAVVLWPLVLFGADVRIQF